MLSGVSIICFASSYAIVLAMEVSRLLFRSGVRGAIMLGWAGAGLFAHTAFLYYRAINTAGLPLSSWQDWYLVTAWLLMVVYLYLLFFHAHTSIGLFILPLVLGLIAMAALVVSPEPFAREPASMIWGVIHGGSLVTAAVSMLVGFAAGMMYIRQAQRLKNKQPLGQGLRLPSLEWLQRINHRAIIIALIMLGVGVLAGIILNLINYQPKENHLPWYDPLVFSTLLMFFWLLAAVVIGHMYKPALQGRKVVYLTVLSFLFLLIALAAGLVLGTQHGGMRKHVLHSPLSTLHSPLLSAIQSLPSPSNN
ncbi:MAG TPA: cytochrome c biogenesis protein CcsA [Thermoguttaceae bacterium]